MTEERHIGKLAQDHPMMPNDPEVPGKILSYLRSDPDHWFYVENIQRAVGLPEDDRTYRALLTLLFAQYQANYLDMQVAGNVRIEDIHHDAQSEEKDIHAHSPLFKWDGQL